MASGTRQKKEYPPLYEKVIPLALGMLVVTITAVLLLALGVALGWVGA